MGRAAAQVPALTVQVTVVVVLIPVFKAKVIRVVTANRTIRGISSSNLVIRVTRSS